MLPVLGWRRGAFMSEPISVTRQELYELIWSQPVVKVASRFGVSDVAVAKACRRHNIPIPGRGYWARIEAGQELKRPPLPEPANASQRIEFSGGKEKSELEIESILPEIAFERDPANQIVVPDELTDPHQLVRRTRTVMRTAKTDEHHLLIPCEDALDVHVSKGQLDRALRIMDGLIKALEKRGRNVAVVIVKPKVEANRYYGGMAPPEPPARPFTRINISGIAVSIGVTEHLKPVPHVMTADEKRNAARGYTYGIPKHDFEPSGNLILSVKDPTGLGVRSTWADGKAQRVENCLNKFIAGLYVIAEAEKKRIQKHQQWEREWKEAEARRLEQQRLRMEEEERIRQLDQNLAAWKKAQDVRAYADALEKLVVARSGAIEAGSDAEKRLQWLRAYAGRIDPLK